MALPRTREVPKSRAATREFRKQQLIDSTIDSIAKRGFSETTLADVADGAGLSRGIVNFHFQSKEQLLVETLQMLADEYREIWQKALAKAGTGTVKRLLAMVAADFEPAVCNRKKIAVWYAFWGEAKSRPTYMKLCADRDNVYADAMLAVCRQLIAEGGYEGLDAAMVAQGMAALTDGLWLDCLVDPKTFDRDRARATAFLFLSALFPRHVTPDGKARG
jgi:TetR/AcrR family transcriptional repressor of bet genes